MRALAFCLLPRFGHGCFFPFPLHRTPRSERERGADIPFMSFFSQRMTYVVSTAQRDRQTEQASSFLERLIVFFWCIVFQEQMVQVASTAVDTILVVISPAARSSRTIKEHLRIASLYQRRLVFVWIAGEEITDVLPEVWGTSIQIDLIDARQTRYQLALNEVTAALQEDETPVAEPLTPGPEFEPRNPYKGLRAFTRADAADFFGRDSLVEQLMDRLKAMLTPGQSGRLLAVIGASGSGKSSVVMAGLLPRLQKGALLASQAWMYLEPMVPGTHPLEALALAFAPRFPGRSVKSIREDLEDESARGLHLLASQFTKAPEQQVVLLIDQFEELFTLTASERERQHFIDLLVTATTQPHRAILVLLTLRADFYHRPMAYPALFRLIEAYQQSVLPMEIAELRAVMRRPAALPDVQLTFEGNLLGDLLFEVQGQMSALPLLEFTLDQLFQRRKGHLLTHEAYREIGGVKGALAKHAEETYTFLPSQQHQWLAQALFLRLIDPGATEQDTTRRRAARSELQLPDHRQTLILDEVVAAFTNARLLTTNMIAGSPTIEVSHEALIREWKRLYEWLREAREDIPLQHAISEDAAAWKQRGQPVDRLYRGSQLAEALTWRERNLPSIDEEAYLAASIGESERQQAAEQERLRQERQQRTRSTRRTVLVGVIGVLLAGMILLGNYLLQLAKGPPNIAGAYQGQVYNTFAKIRAPMTLSIQQNQTSIRGHFTVGAPLSGNGQFTGSVDTKGNIKFLVRSKDATAAAPILFTGAVQPDNTLAGSYCSVKLKNQTQCDPTMGRGVWNASRSKSGLTTTMAFLDHLCLLPLLLISKLLLPFLLW
jgi:hypothetical protein